MNEAPLRVEVLGCVRAWRGDELALGPARQRAVFAALVARAGHAVSRRALIDGVWGAAPPASAAGSVHTYVSGLRRVLEPHRARRSTSEVLISTADGYLLRVEPGNLDFQVFCAHQQRAGSLAAIGDHRGVIAALDAALGLWQGEAFGGVGGPFAEQFRGQLAERRLEVIEQRIRSMLALGEHAELVAELVVLVREHPLRESFWTALIDSLRRSGRHAEALDCVTQVRHTLRQELGTEPGSAIRLLHQQLLVEEPAPQASAPSVAVDRAATTKLVSVLPKSVAHAQQRGPNEPFLGRERETAQLRAFVDDLLAGRGRAALIEGEPGIGKSELLSVALAGARRRGCHVAWAVANEQRQRQPQQVVREALGVEQALGSRRWSAAKPTLASIDDVLEHVETLCARAPLLLVIDDLHRADEASLLVWHRLAAASRQLPLLLVAACRPIDDRLTFARLRRGMARQGAILRLGPLSGAVVADLLTRLLGARPGPTLSMLARNAAGNPLCLRKIVDALSSEDALDISTDGAGRIAEIGSGSSHDAPHALVKAVSSRLDGMSEMARETLRHAAVLGAEFTVTELSATMSKSPSELVDATEEAVQAEVVVEADTRLAFSHPLWRRALNDSTPQPRVSLLHRKAARALADLEAPAERVVEHLIAAGSHQIEGGWVANWLATHHERIAHRAPDAAVDLLTRVLETSPHDPRRDALRDARVRVLDRLGRKPKRKARTALSVITSWADIDDLDTVITRAREVLRTAVDRRDRYVVGHALQVVWRAHSIRRDYHAALRCVEEALNVIRGKRDSAGWQPDLIDNRVFRLHNLDHLDDAAETARSAHALVCHLLPPRGLRDPAAVRHRWHEALIELSMMTENGAASNFHGLGDSVALTLLHGVAALICARRGNTAEALAHIDLAVEQRPATDQELESRDLLLIARSVMAEQGGDLDHAIELMAPTIDPFYARMMLRHQWLPDLVRLAIDTGNLSYAWEALAVCESAAAAELATAQVRGAAARGRALVDDNPKATVAEQYRGVGRRLEMAAALEDAAVLLARDHRLSEARSTGAVAEFPALTAGLGIRRVGTRLRRFDLSADPTEEPIAGPASTALAPVRPDITELIVPSWSSVDIPHQRSQSRRAG